MKDLTAYILAGGKSSRMGTDKGLLHLADKPMVSHICEALIPLVGANIVIVSANKNYDFLQRERIEDIIPDKGPVGGIHAALRHSKTNNNLIISVDVPLVSYELLQWLAESHNNDFQMTQMESHGKTSPLIAVYDKSLESVFEENLKNEQLRLRQIIESIKHQTLQVPEKWRLQTQNINTKDEFNKIAR